MRVRAATLIVLGLLVSTSGCGGDDTPRPGTTTSGSTPSVAVTPADYALRAERRCKRILSSARDLERGRERVRRERSTASFRAYLRRATSFMTTTSKQYARLARLSAPRVYRAFSTGLRREAPVLAVAVRRARRILTADPTLSGLLRASRLLERSDRLGRGPTLPEQLASAAPTCGIINRPGALDGGGGSGGQTAPRGLSA